MAKADSEKYSEQTKLTEAFDQKDKLSDLEERVEFLLDN
jgi:hypothetical protein